MSFILLGILNSQAAGAAGAGSFDLLEQTTLTSNTTTFDITGLSAYSGYRHLIIRGNAFMTTNSGIINCDLRMNNSTNASRYSYEYIYLSGTTRTVGADDANDSIERWYSTQGDSNQAGDAPYFEILLPDFHSTNKAKTFLIKYQVGGFASSIRSGFTTGTYDQPDAVTSIQLSGQYDWAIGSTFSVYGVK